MNSFYVLILSFDNIYNEMTVDLNKKKFDPPVYFR